MLKKSKSFARLPLIILCVILLVVSTTTWFDLIQPLKQTLANVLSGNLPANQISTVVETQVSATLSKNAVWMDIYGGFQAMLGKHEINHFDIIKDRCGALYGEYEELRSDASINALAQSIIEIKKIGSHYDAYTLFVQCPYKNHEKTSELMGYSDSFFETNQNALCTKLKNSIFVLDLRESIPELNMIHYRTDHHWTSEAAFFASQFIIQTLIDQGKLEKYHGETLLNNMNFILEHFPNSFQGSFGIRTGTIFSKKDDFNIYIPIIPTNIQYQHYNQNGEITMQRSGSFQNTLLDFSLLNNNSYKNKYNTFLFSNSIQSVIINNSQLSKKLLVISHSYARAMVPYLSLCFNETLYVDPQPGRYNGDYHSLIKNFKPDIILIMYNDLIKMGSHLPPIAHKHITEG